MNLTSSSISSSCSSSCSNSFYENEVKKFQIEGLNQNEIIIKFRQLLIELFIYNNNINSFIFWLKDKNILKSILRDCYINQNILFESFEFYYFISKDLLQFCSKTIIKQLFFQYQYIHSIISLEKGIKYLISKNEELTYWKQIYDVIIEQYYTKLIESQRYLLNTIYQERFILLGSYSNITINNSNTILRILSNLIKVEDYTISFQENISLIKNQLLSNKSTFTINNLIELAVTIGDLLSSNLLQHSLKETNNYNLPIVCIFSCYIILIELLTILLKKLDLLNNVTIPILLTDSIEILSWSTGISMISLISSNYSENQFFELYSNLVKHISNLSINHLLKHETNDSIFNPILSTLIEKINHDLEINEQQIVLLQFLLTGNIFNDITSSPSSSSSSSSSVDKLRLYKHFKIWETFSSSDESKYVGYFFMLVSMKCFHFSHILPTLTTTNILFKMLFIDNLVKFGQIVSQLFGIQIVSQNNSNYKNSRKKSNNGSNISYTSEIYENIPSISISSFLSFTSTSPFTNKLLLLKINIIYSSILIWWRTIQSSLSSSLSLSPPPSLNLYLQLESVFSLIYSIFLPNNNHTFIFDSFLSISIDLLSSFGDISSIYYSGSELKVDIIHLQSVVAFFMLYLCSSDVIYQEDKVFILN